MERDCGRTVMIKYGIDFDLVVFSWNLRPPGSRAGSLNRSMTANKGKWFMNATTVSIAACVTTIAKRL